MDSGSTSPSGTTKTLNLDSTRLFLSAICSRQSSLSLPPLPSSFPRSKFIPKTRFLIDAFRLSGPFSASYFLSHFHSDHYAGLSPSWSYGLIFCSSLTARLLVKVLNIPKQLVFPLSLNVTVVIDNCEVTMVDANHCPGAVQFLFSVPSQNGGFQRYVHTGDFRFSASMETDACLTEFVGCDAVFLDTTYCHPKYVFPSQQESIDYVVGVIQRIGGDYSQSRKAVLFLVATYVVGKEKILVEIARRCNKKIHVDRNKMVVLGVLGYADTGAFTVDESLTDVHVVGWNVLGDTWPYFRPNFASLNEIMVEKGYDKVVGFVPTGWTYEVKRNKFTVKSKDSFEIHLVPYSEHSNYDELRQYVKFLKPKKVIPTVGMDIEKLDSKHANKMKKYFAGLVDEMANKKEFLSCLHRQLHENDKTEVISDSNVQEKLELGKRKYPSGIEAPENVDVCVCSENSSCPPAASSQKNLSALTDEVKENIFLEFCDCLPNWVTKEQMLDLFRSSDGNVVDAVSKFYEREAQFSELVSASAPVVFLTNKSTSLLKSAHCKYECEKTVTDQLTKTGKSPNLKLSTNCSISPGKSKKSTSSKGNKKAKGTVNFEAGGPKQSMITRYFNKFLPGSSQDMVTVLKTEECSKNKNVSACNTIGAYIKEIDQFIEITGCNETSRSQAATILLKTKGDICKALDVYYSNSEGQPTHGIEKKGDLEISVHLQDNVSDFNEEKSLVEESGHTVSSSMQETGSFGINLVSLHPDRYKPIEHACWARGESAPYIHLARTFDMIEGEKGKIKATSMLCNMFRSLLALSPEDVLSAAYLCTNKIAADHENIELNIGGSLVSSTLEEACGVPRSRLRDMYNKFGDLGDVAQLCRQTQKLLMPPPPLSIRDVFSTLQKISVQTGNGSTMRKKDLILNLIRSSREKEMKFLVRTLVRNLRIGAMIRTILPALAQAVVMNSSLSLHVEGTTDNLKEKLKFVSAEVVEAYNILPNLDLIVPLLIEKGMEFSSSALSMSPGVPIKPMLAKITNGIPEVLKRFQNKAFTCEYKYDGQRAQIHKLGGEVRVFSRNGDETTSKFPDVVDTVKKTCKPDVQTFILDAEVVAVDRKNGCKLMSFQELSSRERGSKNSSITVEHVKIDVCIYAFDIMFANGEQLLSCPLSQRRKYLRDLFREKPGYFECAREITVEANDASLTCEATSTRINYFLEDALRLSCEGIMVKSLDVDAGYFPSKRSDSWLKVKQDYVEGLNDSLDLVPIGAWHGNGRKAGWYSPFLMACYDPENEEFQSVCRVMSGFSDAFYMEMKTLFSGDKILAMKPSYYRTSEVPDVWFSAELVWEIRGADLTVSPVHEAARGLVHPSRGISIRFPRFIRGVMDRNSEDCSTAAEVAERFLSQTRKMDVKVGLGE